MPHPNTHPLSFKAVHDRNYSTTPACNVKITARHLTTHVGTVAAFMSGAIVPHVAKPAKTVAKWDTLVLFVAALLNNIDGALAAIGQRSKLRSSGLG